MNPFHFDMADMLFFLLVIFIIFLAIREILCWYWKINAQLNTQEKIQDTLEDILKELRYIKQNNTQWSENTIAANKINTEREVTLNSEFKETIETNKFII